jgi:hypothetical protein
MLKAAFHSALECTRHVFNRVGVRDAVHAWPACADGGHVGRKLFAEFGVDAALVGMQGTLARTTHANDAANLVFGCAVNVERANASTAFD